MGELGDHPDGGWANPEALKTGEEPGQRASGGVLGLVIFVGCILSVVFIENTLGRMIGFALSAFVAVTASVFVGRVYTRMRSRRIAETHEAYHASIDSERLRQMAEFKAKKATKE